MDSLQRDGLLLDFTFPRRLSTAGENVYVSKKFHEPILLYHAGHRHASGKTQNIGTDTDFGIPRPKIEFYIADN